MSDVVMATPPRGPRGGGTLRAIAGEVPKLLGYTVAILTSLAAVQTLRAVWRRRDPTSPPGPFPLPLIGNFHQLKPLPHRALQQMHRRYGSLITVWMGNQRTVVIGSPEIVKQTHKDQSEHFQHRVLTDFAKLSLHADAEGGKNVALAGGKYWKKARRIFVQELMSSKFINEQSIPKVVEEIWSAIDAMKELNGAPFDPHEHLQRLSLNIVFRLTYGIRFGREQLGAESSRFSELMKVIGTIVKIGGTNVMANYIPILKFLNWGLQAKRVETISNRDAILMEIMREHRQTLDKANPRDFLDVLLVKQAAENLADDEVMLIAWEFITAGTDTTSATMHWMSLVLANRPDVQQKAQAEIDRVCPGRAVSMEDQARLPYCNAVIKETMRWMPVVPMMVPYRTNDAVEIMSEGKRYVIPHDTQVLVNGFNMQRDPALWKDPDSFNPERFMEGPDADIELRGADAQNDPHHLKFLPLGTGRRACAGYALAKVELFLQGATLLQCFTWEPPAGQVEIPVVEMFGIAVSPAHFEVVAKFRPEAEAALSAARSRGMHA